MFASGLIPTAVSQIVVAADGSLAAVIDAARAIVVPLAGGEGFEVGLPSPDSDLAWLGRRILVVSRTDGHTTAHLIDTADNAPRAIAEIRLEAAMRLVGAVGAHALLIGPRGPAILTASESGLAPYQFMTRVSPTVFGVAAGVFLVGLPGMIEEWDPVSRAPRRRFKLARSGTIAALGGTERVVWWWMQQEPARIEVLPLINRGQPKVHDLPEPIGVVLAHPQSDTIACVAGATLHAVDLDGRVARRNLPTPLARIDAAALVVSRGVAAIVAENRKPLALISIDGRELAPAESRTRGSDGRDLESRPRASSQPGHEVASSLFDADDDRLGPSEVALRSETASRSDTFAPGAPPPGPTDLLSKLAAMRSAAFDSGPTEDSQRFETRALPVTRPSNGSGPLIVPKASGAAPMSWRDEAVAWVRSIASSGGSGPAPDCPPIDALATRLELATELTPALVLLYGAHLAGFDGCAPVDVAQVLGRRWEEALGRGRFAALGVAVYERSRVIMAPAILRVLDDELP